MRPSTAAPPRAPPKMKKKTRLAGHWKNPLTGRWGSLILRFSGSNTIYRRIGIFNLKTQAPSYRGPIEGRRIE